MIDIFFVNSVINIIWYIFSILFVLYKFTSFFSYIYNFGKFLGKITKSLFYIKDRVVEFTEQRRNQYITRPTRQPKSQSFFTRIKSNITSYFWGSQKEELGVELPIYTTISDVTFKPTKNKKEDLHFENCINEMMSQSKNSFVSIDLSNHQNKIKTYDSSCDGNYESYYDTKFPSNLFNTNSDNDSESECLMKKDIESCPQVINVENESENTKQKFNIQDSNMLFNSNFIKNTLKY